MKFTIKRVYTDKCKVQDIVYKYMEFENPTLLYYCKLQLGDIKHLVMIKELIYTVIVQ